MPINNAVVAPTAIINDKVDSDSSNNGDIRVTIKMPAVTIVAARISAEIGVGPSIESGSQTCSGNCADFPIAPIKRHKQVTVNSPQFEPGNMKPKSPTRFTINAFILALMALSFVYQKPISK